MLQKIIILRNLKYLCTKSLAAQEEKNMFHILDIIEQNYCYFGANEKKIKKPKIYDYQETIKILQENPKSFCRIGDGELEIIMGNSIPFQSYHPRLAKYLCQILINQLPQLHVGINYEYFYPTDYINEFTRRFVLLNSTKYRRVVLQYCNFDNYYIDAAFTQKYISSENLNLDRHYTLVKELFSDKDIVLFAGKGVLDNLHYNLLDVSNNIRVVDAPSRDAFSEFDRLMKVAIEFPREMIRCFILGPTSKPLVYELSKRGYIAWDIGHLLKDYDFFMKKKQKSSNNIVSFFSPD